MWWILRQDQDPPPTDASLYESPQDNQKDHQSVLRDGLWERMHLINVRYFIQYLVFATLDANSAVTLRRNDHILCLVSVTV